MGTQKQLLKRASLKALGDVVREFGSMSKLAAALGITKGAVSQWKLKGRGIPAKHCQRIQALTNGRVTCEQLNPEIFSSHFHQVNSEYQESA